MGSSTKSTSSTSYLNTPLTLDNNQNGMALAGNTGLQLGGLGNVSGSTRSGNNSNNSTTKTDTKISESTKIANSGSFSTVNQTLDAGAIARAFESSDKSIAGLLDITAKVLSNQSAAGVSALAVPDRIESSVVANADPATISKPESDKTWVMLGVGAIVAYFLIKGFK